MRIFISGFIPFILLLSGSACRNSKVLKSDGLKYAKLGGEMIPAGMSSLKGHTVRDTLCNENDYQWRVVLVNYPNGRVWVEEDFFGSKVINRIRVETPDIQLPNRMKVGINISRLLEMSSEWYITPMPLYQKFDFFSPLLPGYHFVVDEPNHAMDSPNYEDYPVRGFNPLSKVVAIVVY